ncbi:hypothetical protein PQX77_012151 [Marasmius sp. AFHP31]|nr:hypothetical protein PQX77_012151 [Marasmius sp. AFHP31]
MYFTVWTCLFAVTTQEILALQVSFPTPLTAATTVSFQWTREQGDRDDSWLRKQKLDDGDMITGLSEPFQVHLGNEQRGTSNIVFNRAGSFIIYIYDEQGRNKSIRNPTDIGKWTTNAKKAFHVIVSTNPTSAGAIVPPSTTELRSATTSNASSGPPPKPEGDIGLIVGSILGVTLFIFTIVTALLCIRYRRRRATIAFQKSRMIGVDDRRGIESRFGSDIERKPAFNDDVPMPPLDHNPPATSEYSSGSFSATSPIARAMRERERSRNKLLRLSSSTITSSSHSTATSTPSYVPPPPRTRTDRQMLIEEKIQLLQSKMILLQSQCHTSIQFAPETPRIRPLPLPPGSLSTLSPLPPTVVSGMDTEELERLGRTVERLKQLHESDWALMLTNVAPEGLHD